MHQPAGRRHASLHAKAPAHPMDDRGLRLDFRVSELARAAYTVGRTRVHVTARVQPRHGGNVSPRLSAIWVVWQLLCQIPDFGQLCPVVPDMGGSVSIVVSPGVAAGASEHQHGRRRSPTQLAVPSGERKHSREFRRWRGRGLRCLTCFRRHRRRL
jgi:hypothetical protein